jgi:hypothetical protein
MLLDSRWLFKEICLYCPQVSLLRDEKMDNLFTKSVALAGTLITVGATTFAATNAANAFTVKVSPIYGSTENTGAMTDLNFNFSQQGANVLLQLGITNTTDGSEGLGATQATLVGIGFNLPTGISVVSYDPGSSAFTKVFGAIPGASDSAALPPLGTFDIGIRSAGPGNFVGGNPQSGLTAGDSTSVSFVFGGIGNLLAGDVENAFLNLFSNSAYPNPGAQIAGRFQEVNAGGGSDKVAGQVPGGQPIPTPALLPGLVALGVGILRKHKGEQIGKTEVKI